MPRQDPRWQRRIAEEIALKVSPHESVLAVRAMRMLASYNRPERANFLRFSADDLEAIFVIRKVSDATKRRYLGTIWWIYEIAARLGIVRENPADDVHLAASKPTHPDFLIERSLVDDVIAHCWSDLQLGCTHRIAFRTLLKLALVYALSSGAFLSELPAVRCCDLSTDGLVVGRGARKRKLFLSSDALTALRNYRSVREVGMRKRHGSALFFVTELGTPMYFKLIWKLVDKVIRESGAAERGLTPAKLQRGSVKLVGDTELDWLNAFSMHGYQKIPKVKLKPYSAEELAGFVDRLHPMSASAISF